MSKKRVVVVTGFGPFGDHSVNSSWECAKELEHINLEKEFNIDLIIEELPVIYNKVQTIVPRIWRDIKPDVLIHLGAHNENHIKIECLARKEGYNRDDIIKNKPCDGRCPVGTHGSIRTAMDIEMLAKILHNRNICDIQFSDSAGNYLCEFTYYLSLNEDPSRCLFVHIPPYDEKMIKDIALKVKQIIISALQLSER